MKIHYQDDYGVNIYSSADNTVLPSVGDDIVFDGEEWKVKSRTFYLNDDAVIVEITQNVARSSAKVGTDGRLNEVKQSIIRLASRQDITDKKVRSSSEQVSSIRKHINTQIQKDSKNDT